MKTASAKAKGRRLQQHVRDLLRQLGSKHGLTDGDVESRGMGQSGADLILSPAAQRVFDSLAVECKNVEKLNVGTTFEEHYQKYSSKSGLVMLAHSRNRTEPLATLRLSDFMRLLAAAVQQRADETSKKATVPNGT